MRHVPVLIVGGSLVGLSASVFLRHHHVPHLLTDKHRCIAPHSRAMGFTQTTMEHYRACGIADRPPQADPSARLRRVQVETLFGDWAGETEGLPASLQIAVRRCHPAPVLRSRRTGWSRSYAMRRSRLARR